MCNYYCSSGLGPRRNWRRSAKPHSTLLVKLLCRSTMSVTLVSSLSVTDSKLMMESHVQSVTRSCFYQLRQLRSIQRSLTANARRLLAVAFIASRIDYCNAVLYNIPDTVVQQFEIFLLSLQKFDDQMTFHLLIECGRFGIVLWPFYSLWPFWFVAVLDVTR